MVDEAFQSGRKNDFLFFDGNAFGARVLTRLQGWREKSGLRLSSTCLGAFSKYPFTSDVGANLLKKGEIKQKKFGYFMDDARTIEANFTNCRMQQKSEGHYTRHPLSYIVEAADDIAYYVTDIFDGFKYKLIEFEDAETALLKSSKEFHRKNYDSLKKTSRQDDKIQYLMSAVISSLADDAFLAFVWPENLSRINSGAFEGALLDYSDHHDGITNIKSRCREKLYSNRAKM